MQPSNLKSFVLAAVAALGVGLGVAPKEARADVNINWSLLPQDSCNPNRPGCHEQLHAVYLQAGVTYNIDLTSSAFDTYLYLEDQNGTVLAENDDYPGMGLNSRVVFTPAVSGNYNVVATSFAQGATGNYNVAVYTSGGGSNPPTYNPPVNNTTYYPPVNNTTYYPPVNNTTYYPPVNSGTYYPPANGGNSYPPGKSNVITYPQTINGVPGYTTQWTVNGKVVSQWKKK